MDTPFKVQFQSVTPSPGSPAELLLQARLHEYVDWARTEGTVDIAMIGRRIKTETGRSIFRDCIGFHHEKAGHISLKLCRIFYPCSDCRFYMTYKAIFVYVLDH